MNDLRAWRIKTPKAFSHSPATVQVERASNLNPFKEPELRLWAWHLDPLQYWWLQLPTFIFCPHRNLLYGLNTQSPRFSILKDAQEVRKQQPVNQTLSLVFNAIRSAQRLVQSGLELFENDPDASHWRPTSAFGWCTVVYSSPHSQQACAVEVHQPRKDPDNSTTNVDVIVLHWLSWQPKLSRAWKESQFFF